MNTQPLNTGPINAPAGTQPVLLSFATRVSVSRRFFHAASASTKVNRIGSNDFGTAVAVCAQFTVEVTTMLSVAGAAQALAATNVAAEHRVSRGFVVGASVCRNAEASAELLADIRKSLQTEAASGVSVAHRAEAVIPSGIRVARIARSDSAMNVRIDRIHPRLSQSGVSIARAKSITAITGVFLAKEKAATIHAAVYISRRPQHDYASNIRVDRRRTRGCRSNIFVGRRRQFCFASALSVGAWQTRDSACNLKIDRRRRRDTATGLQVNRSYFGQHMMDLLPSVWRERDNGDLAAFLRLPADELDLVKNSIDRMPSLWDVDACPPEYLQLLALTLGWPFDPAKHVETLRRELREAISFYRRKGTIPAVMRSLENVGWRGRLFETFRGMLRTNRRGQLNAMRLAGTVYNQGVYRVESENVAAGIREALMPHHPAGVRVFFLQRLHTEDDLSSEIEAGFKLGFRRADGLRQHEILSLNRDLLNGPRPLTIRRFAFETMLIRHGAYARQDISESYGIVEQWQARRPLPSVNRMVLNTTSLANTYISPLRMSLEHDNSTAPQARRIQPLRLGKARINRSGLPAGNVYRWRFRQIGEATETSAALDSAVNDWLVREWPAA